MIYDTEKDYTAALVEYTKAIQLAPTSAIYYANRAFTHIRLESCGSAVADATRAIELDPKYVKVKLFCRMLMSGFPSGLRQAYH